MSSRLTSITNSLSDLLIDPISYELMQDPVIDPCGHTFERVQIQGWLRINASCPLSRRPMTAANLINNLIVRDALEVLAHAPASVISGNDTIGDLSDEDQQIVQMAMASLNRQRANDQENEIPDRLATPRSFLANVLDKSRSCG